MKTSKIQIVSTQVFKDGGTIQINTTIGPYFLDHRIKSETDGVLFDRYPSEDGAVQIDAKHSKQIMKAYRSKRSKSHY
jgi:hypothetical protein